MTMKIRFGVGLGAGPEASPEQLPHLVDRLEAAGIDSLWFSELVYTDAVDPFVGMAYALARTTNLKVGTSVMILPGRHPVLVAKQLASLAALAPKRVLPVFGLRSAIPAERDVFVVPDGQRAAVFDESLRLLKEALTADGSDFCGDFFTATSIAVGPRPVKQLDIWLGGSAPAAFHRIGRLADGWLGSFLTPEEARRGRVAVAENGLPDEVLVAIRKRRPDVDPTELVADGWPQLHRMIDGYLAAGLTKFVIRPTGSGSTDEFIDRFAAELLPREN